MKAWITKYALTQGIYEIDAEICTNTSTDMIQDINNKYIYYHGEGRQWHSTKEAAIIKATQMRDRKVKALHTQLNKLNKLTFS